MRRLAALALLATTAIGCDSSTEEPSPAVCGHSERYAGSGEFDEQSSMVVGETVEVGIRPSESARYEIELRLNFDPGEPAKRFTLGVAGLGCDGNFSTTLVNDRTGEHMGEAEGQISDGLAQGSWELTTGEFGTWSASPT